MSGELILLIIVLLFLFMTSLGFYCHFCYGESGGRSFVMMDDKSYSGPKVHIVKRKKCKCSDKFKGICNTCEGPEFVGQDGGYRVIEDFSDFGGDKGLGESNGDPIRGLLHNPSSSGNTQSYANVSTDISMEQVVYIS